LDVKEIKVDGRLFSQEYDIIRILLNYGLYMVKTEHYEENDEGQQELVEVEVSVTELIVHEIDKDEIILDNPTFKVIYELFKEGIAKNELYGEKFFLQHPDPNISKMAVDIISNRHEISPKWTEKKVYTTPEV